MIFLHLKSNKKTQHLMKCCKTFSKGGFWLNNLKIALLIMTEIYEALLFFFKDVYIKSEF